MPAHARSLVPPSAGGSTPRRLGARVASRAGDRQLPRVVALAALLLAASPADTVPRTQHALALLDYVAGDYPSAVGPNGELLSADELKEQASFARECADELRPVE